MHKLILATLALLAPFALSSCSNPFKPAIDSNTCWSDGAKTTVASLWQDRLKEGMKNPLFGLTSDDIKMLNPQVSLSNMHVVTLPPDHQSVQCGTSLQVTLSTRNAQQKLTLDTVADFSAFLSKDGLVYTITGEDVAKVLLQLSQKALSVKVDDTPSDPQPQPDTSTTAQDSTDAQGIHIVHNSNFDSSEPPPADVAALISREEVVNSRCRDSDPDSAKGKAVCAVRDVLSTQIGDKNWCWGHPTKPDASEAEMIWVPCNKDKTRSYVPPSMAS